MARGKAVIEVSVDASGAIAGIQQVSAEMTGLGKAGSDAARETASLDGRLNALLNRLDPVRAATQRYERDLDLLTKGYQAGKISAAEYERAIAALQRRLEEKTSVTTKAAAGLDELTTRFLGVPLSTVGITAAIGGIVTALGASVSAAAAAEASQARLEAVIKATGGTAGFTAQQLSDFATELQASTGIGDEAIKDAMSVLLTFRSISGDTFKEATKLALDLSAVFGQDLKSSAVQLGKALEDPIQGITALRRVGVTFTEEQREMISALVESGQLLEAQAQVLEAVRVQVGGAAEAIGGTYAGSIAGLRESIGDLAEAIGGLLLPILKPLIDHMTKLTTQTKELIEAFGGRGWRGLIDTIGDALVGMGLLSAEAANATAAELGLKREIMAAKDALTQVQKPLTASTKAVDDLGTSTKIATKSLSDHMKAIDDIAKKGPVKAKVEFKSKWDPPKFEPVFAEAHLNWVVEPPPVPDIDVEAVFGIVPPPPTEWEKLKYKFTEMGTMAAAAVAPSITDGILATLEGDDFAAAWGGIFHSLGRMASNILDNTFKVLLNPGGGSLMERLQAGGWVIPGGGVNWAQVSTVGGSLLWGYGAAQGNRGMGATGGAISGASMGFSLAGGWGAVIGAIIGGIVGYFTSGTKSYGYNVDIDRYGRGVVDITGVSQAEEDERLRQLRDAARGYFAGFRSLLELLGQEQPDISQWQFSMHGKAGDVGAIWRQILTAELPRSIFRLYQPAIESGLGQLGVSQGRVTELMEGFQTGQFETAIKELQDYINVLLDINKLMKDFGRSTEELRAELTKTVEQQLLDRTQDVLAQVRTGIAAMAGMTSAEQVTRAQQLVGLIQQQGQALVQYINQVFAAQQAAAQQAADIRFGWEWGEVRQKNKAIQVTWYQQKLEEIQRDLTGATDLQTAQALWQRATQLIQGLHELDAGAAASALDIIEQLYKRALDRLAEQAKGQLEDLNSALDSLKGVLTTESMLRQTMTEDLRDEQDARRDIRNSLEEEERVRRRLIDAEGAYAATLGLAAAAAASAASALAGLASATTAVAPALPPATREVI